MAQYTVGDFQDRDDIQLETDPEEIQLTLDYFDLENEGYGFLLVADKDGEITEIYASEYDVPAINCPVQKLV